MASKKIVCDEANHVALRGKEGTVAMIFGGPDSTRGDCARAGGR